MSPGARWRVFDDEAVAFVAERSETHLLDASAAAVLDALAGAGRPVSAGGLVSLLWPDASESSESEAEPDPVPTLQAMLTALAAIGAVTESAC